MKPDPFNNIPCTHENMELMSVCCGASPIEETDFCGACRDHTGFERVCQDCDYFEAQP